MIENNRKKRYLPSVDGLRALAIIFVMLYHFQFPFSQGGFIGVDIFFVLSGYLITNTLMLEWQNNKRIDIKKFWFKRLRRLLPAVLGLLVVILIICFCFFPKIFQKSWGDSLAALFYASNWWYIFNKVPYFDSFGTPSPFKHLWSLAIEAQFYMLWPLVLFGLLRWLKKRQRVLVAIVGGILASALLMALLYNPSAIDRVYYGTDTRLFALLIGCSLAFLWPYYLLEDTLGRKSKQVLDILGSIALGAIILIALFINEYQSFLYRGGFLLVALLTGILLGTLVHPSSQLSKLFTNPFFSWIGKRSYSLYLWHYPIVVLSTPIKLLGRFQPVLVLGQLLLILVVADFSYRVIEEPIRKIGIKKSLSHLKKAKRKDFYLPIVSLLIIVVLSLGVWGTGGFLTRNKGKQPVVAPVTTNSQSQDPEKKVMISQVLAIGDSIMLGIKDQLEEAVPGIVVDGKVGRQLVDAKQLVTDKYLDFNHDQAAIFVELGSNSPFNSKDLQGFLTLFTDARVYLINTRVPVNWEKEVNDLLAEAANKNKNVELIDWYSLAITNPDLLEGDGVHLIEGPGKDTYTQLITHQLADFKLNLTTKEEQNQSKSDESLDSD